VFFESGRAASDKGIVTARRKEIRAIFHGQTQKESGIGETCGFFFKRGKLYCKCSPGVDEFEYFLLYILELGRRDSVRFTPRGPKGGTQFDH